MGKFLRVLVVLLFLASVAALVMAHILFNRREVLVARVETMHRGLAQLARTLETESPESPTVAPSYPERDISPITAEAVPSPRRAQFWRNYQVELEEVDRPLMDLSARRQDLMTLYRIDAQGIRITDGPGTMHGVIENLVTRAVEQYGTLTATRQQLQLLRQELVSVINDYNELRNDLRAEKAIVVRVSAERDEHRRAAEQTRRELAQANERGRELELRIADMEQDMLVLREEKDTLRVRNEEQIELITSLRQQITDLERIGVRDLVDEGTIPTGVARIDVEVGDKGSIVSADHNYMFVVVQLDDTFMEELIGASEDGRLPVVELYVERVENGQRTFITKIRLIQIKRDQNLAIGDIQLDWHQKDVRPGDRVVYQ